MMQLKPTLKLSMFKEIRIVQNDTWNNIKNGEVSLCYFNNKKDTSGIDLTDVESVRAQSDAYINFRLHTGQVGLFFIDEKYQNRSLGKQILLKTISEMKMHDVPAVWAITAKGHPFWSNVFGKQFKYSSRPHRSVTGDGYIIHI